MDTNTGNWFSNQKKVSDAIQNLDSNGEMAEAAITAEHGAGAIGTGTIGAPQTRRWTENGVIITQIKFDLTGLGVVGTAANDVIGLAIGVAYIGRYVVATDGVIYKTELICLEAPTTGDTDINVVELASAELIFEANGGTDYVVDGGVAVKGGIVENFVPALTANEYWYLTAGASAGGVTGTYATGMFILRIYGHAVLA